MLTPLVIPIIWTLIVWVWMYATRIPAMKKANIDLQTAIQAYGGVGVTTEFGLARTYSIRGGARSRGVELWLRLFSFVSDTN